MPISVNNKEIVAINCEGREIVRAHAGLSLVFSKQEDLYGGMDISSIADLVMFRDLINTGTCIWNGVSTNTYKGNTIATGGLGSTWYVTADIDMSSVCSSSLGSWVPIGTSSRPFAGTIEGLNFTISNLYISTGLQDFALFGYVRGTTMRNLTVNGSVQCAGYAAILVSRIIYNTTSFSNIFENIQITGSVICTGRYAAGVVAYSVSPISNTNSSVMFNDCINYANVIASGELHIAGIAGYLGSSIQPISLNNCVNFGYIEGRQSAGIVATLPNSTATFEDCVNSGQIESDSLALGIAERGVFKRCKNDVTAAINSTGGAIGIGRYVLLNSESCINKGAINGNGAYGIAQYIEGSNHTNYGRVSGGTCAGIAYENASLLSNCVNYGNVTGSSTSYCAGIVLYPKYDLQYCVNHGDIEHTGANQCGGIVATTFVAKIIKCVNYGQVTGKSTCGGIAGYSRSEVNLCANYGAVNGYGGYVGGIVGRLGASSIGPIAYCCANYGTVTQLQVGNYGTGGIIGYLSYASCVACLNTAQIISNVANTRAAAIAGDLFNDQTLESNYYNNTIESVFKAFENFTDIAGEGEGRPTSNLLGNSLLGAGSGWTTDNWVFTAGEYPTPRMD